MRFRLDPTPEQELALREHCSHARFVWNLCVEQQSYYVKAATSQPPTHHQRAAQLTEIRREFDWLRAGSVIVQQQALRDFDQSMQKFFRNTHGKPGFRRQGRNEGFRIVTSKPEHARRLTSKVGQVWIPKVGWVRFRWSRQVTEFKSFCVTLDRSARWHVGFTIIPPPIPAPSNGRLVGVDRGVKVSVALSNGELLSVQGLSVAEARRLLLLERKFARCKNGSNRRIAVKLQIAKLKAHEVDRRKDWVEKLSTRLAREYDVIGLEDLKIKNMTKSAKGTVETPGKKVRQKAGLTRGILSNGWGLLSARLGDKAPGRVVKVPAAYTSQRCSACGFKDPNNRKSQAVFECATCGFACNADVNAALNIKTAAGLAVAAQALSIGAIAELACEPTGRAVMSNQGVLELKLQNGSQLLGVRDCDEIKDDEAVKILAEVNEWLRGDPLVRR